MKTIADPQKLIDLATSYGFQLSAEDGKVNGNPISKGASIPQELIEQIRRNKERVISLLTAKPVTPTKPSSRQELAAMLTRLESGECSAVRIYAHNLKAEVWFVRDDVVMESDRVTFTLSELKKLAGVSTEHLKKVYLVKKEFGAQIESDTK